MALGNDIQKKRIRVCRLIPVFFLFLAWISAVLIGQELPDSTSSDTVSVEPPTGPVLDNLTVIQPPDTDTLTAAADSSTVGAAAESDSLSQTADSLRSAGADSVTAPEPAPEDTIMQALMEEDKSVSYSGDTIETLPSEDVVYISGDAELKYQDSSLGADEITYDMEKESLTASGETYLKDKSGEIYGQKMEYSLKEEKGIISDARTQHEEWYFTGEKISKIGDEDLYGKDSRFTTCDLEEPHYHFRCRKLKLKIGDKVIARPIIFYVRDIPFFIFPFYVFPIESGRKSGILKPNIGLFSDDERGRSITNLGYFWAANDYYDVTVGTDLYQRLRWTVWGEARYKKRYSYDGRIYSSYTKDTSRGDRRRGEYIVKHNQTLNKKSSFRVDLNIATDRNIYKDLSYDINQVLQRSLKSRVTYNRSEKWGSYYMSFDSDYSLEREQTIIQAPIFSITKNSTSVFKPKPGEELPLWYRKLAYGASGDFAYKNIKRTETTGGDTVDVRANLENSNLSANMTNPMQFFGWLNVSPGFSYREILFHSDEEGVGLLNQGTYTLNTTVFTRLYGIFEGPRLGPVTKWRHTISPQVRYSFSPASQTVGAGNSQFYQGLSSTGTNILFLTLSNDLDAKYRKGEGEKTEMKNLTLARFVLGTTYNIKTAREGKPGWGNLSSRLESNPSDRFKFSLEGVHSLFDDDRFDPFLTSLTTNFTLKGSGKDVEAEETEGLEGSMGDEYLGQRAYGDRTGMPGTGSMYGMGMKGPWSFTITHNLSKSRTGSSTRQSIRNSVGFNPSRKWRLLYSYQYDLTNGELQDQSLTLRRDLHRWEMYISLRQLPGDRFSYEFRVNLKDIPALEVRRSAQTP